MLVIQNREDANDVLARRISLIYSRFDGGLGEFFERLHCDRRKHETASAHCEFDRASLRLKESAIRKDQPDCADD